MLQVLLAYPAANIPRNLTADSIAIQEFPHFFWFSILLTWMIIFFFHWNQSSAAPWIPGQSVDSSFHQVFLGHIISKGQQNTSLDSNPPKSCTYYKPFTTHWHGKAVWHDEAVNKQPFQHKHKRFAVSATVVFIRCLFIWYSMNGYKG